MGNMLWWAGNAIVAVAVLPVVAFLALRIIRALRTVQTAAVDIRTSLQTVAGGIAPATRSLADVAARCEELSGQGMDATQSTAGRVSA